MLRPVQDDSLERRVSYSDFPLRRAQNPVGAVHELPLPVVAYLKELNFVNVKANNAFVSPYIVNAMDNNAFVSP
jgi:hypothetical protein